jgi:hypothetical protein
MRKTLTRCRSIALRMAVLVAVALASVGCTEMKFVLAPPPSQEEDPRENIVLTGVDAQFTSGSLVQNRILAQQGVLHDTKGLLILTRPVIQFHDVRSTQPAETHATTATFFLAEDRKTKHQKGDVVLTGRVRHAIPSKDDPTTASVLVETENLVWRAATQIFEGNSFYRMTLNVPGKAPIVTIGDAFIASRDLRNWNVRYGGLATQAVSGDFRRDNIEKSRALERDVPSSPPELTEAGGGGTASASGTGSPRTDSASPPASTETRVLRRIPNMRP